MDGWGRQGVKVKHFVQVLAGGVLALALSSAAASAASVVVKVGGFDYRVTTKFGTFIALNDAGILDGTRLDQQIWWGKQTLAKQFSEAVGLGLGPNASPLSFGAGPLFAYAGGEPNSLAVPAACFGFNDFLGCSSVSDVDWTYAVATQVPPVPLPAGAPLVLSGLAALAGLGWRRRREGRRAQA